MTTTNAIRQIWLLKVVVRSTEPLGSEFIFGGVRAHDLPFKDWTFIYKSGENRGQILQFWEKYKIEATYPNHDCGYETPTELTEG